MAATAAISTGCATQRGMEPVFYPPAPDAPRLQFLKSFSNSDDVGEQSSFSRFILGAFAPKPIVKPYGLAVHSNCIYVCDTMLGAISVLDLEHRRMDYFTPPGEGRLVKPINVAIDDDGTRYVADSERGQVLVFDSSGKYLAALGEKAEPRLKPSTVTPPKDPEKNDSATPEKKRLEMRPTDVLLSSNRIFVADIKGHCVRVYDKEHRAPLMTITGGTTNEEARLFSPTNLARDRQGRLYEQGVFIRSFGRYGDRYGELARPKGVAVDREGRVFVVDSLHDAVQIFDAAGQLLLSFGQPGTSPVSLTIPAKVALDYDHVKYFQKYAAPGFQLEYLLLITNQYGGRKVSVYGFGHK